MSNVPTRTGDKKHGLFWFGDWSMPDPHEHKLAKAMWKARYCLDKLTQDEAYKILCAAESYCHLAGHPASTESIIKQLRAIRRAVRIDTR